MEWVVISGTVVNIKSASEEMMPYGDGTGPRGFGPRSGRGSGRCGRGMGRGAGGGSGRSSGRGSGRGSGRSGWLWSLLATVAGWALRDMRRPDSRIRSLFARKERGAIGGSRRASFPERDDSYEVIDAPRREPLQGQRKSEIEGGRDVRRIEEYKQR